MRRFGKDRSPDRRGSDRSAGHKALEFNRIVSFEPSQVLRLRLTRGGRLPIERIAQSEWRFVVWDRQQINRTIIHKLVTQTGDRRTECWRDRALESFRRALKRLKAEFKFKARDKLHLSEQIFGELSAARRNVCGHTSHHTGSRMLAQGSVCVLALSKPANLQFVSAHTPDCVRRQASAPLQARTNTERGVRVWPASLRLGRLQGTQTHRLASSFLKSNLPIFYRFLAD